MSKHTAGPWYVDRYSRNVVLPRVRIDPIDGNEVYEIMLVAQVTNPENVNFRRDDPVMYKNACLIAAAPDLYKIVSVREKSLSRVVRESNAANDQDIIELQILRQVLAKAEGRKGHYEPY